MKAWNPKSKQFDAVPPLPEFVGRWQVEASEDEEDNSLRRRMRSFLRRAYAALGVLLDIDRSRSPRTAPFAEPSAEPTWVPTWSSSPHPVDRIVLPMSSGVRIKPGESAKITSRPQNMAFRPERIVIGGEPNHWLVNEIKIGRRSQLADSGDLPGAAFTADAQDAHVRLDVVLTAMNFTMVVTYVGPDPEGALFVCSATGVTGIPEGGEGGAGEGCADDKASAAAMKTDRIYLPLSSGVRILPGTSMQVTAHPQDPFRPERIIIGGDPNEWIVNDVRVGNRSQFSQKGDIPGVGFAATAQNSSVSFETVQVAMDFTISATYVGTKKEGEPFLACAIGSVPA